MAFINKMNDLMQDIINALTAHKQEG